MDKPTKAQEIEFWEWCGFKRRPDQDFVIEYATHEYATHEVWEWPNGLVIDTLPRTDLNNLFQYAVPRLNQKYEEVQWLLVHSEGYGWEASIYAGQWLGEAKDDDPALALFWAIYKVIKC